VGEAAWVLYSWRDGGVWLLPAVEVLAAGLLLTRASTSGLGRAAVRSGCWAAVATVPAHVLYRVL
jgi:hypothetical protein